MVFVWKGHWINGFLDPQGLVGESMSLLNLYEINSMELLTGGVPTVACRPSLSWICLVGVIFTELGLHHGIQATIKSTKFRRIYFLELFFPHDALFSCLKKESGIIPRRLFFFLLYFSDRNTSSRATGEKSSKAVANQKNGQTWTVETTCRIFYGFRGVQGFTGWSYREL